MISWIQDNVSFVLESNERFCECWVKVHLHDLKQALQWRQCSYLCRPCVFCRCGSLPVTLICSSSRSNAERGHHLSGS